MKGGWSWWSDSVQGDGLSLEATGWVAASGRAWLGGGMQPCSHVHGTEHQEHEGNSQEQEQK